MKVKSLLENYISMVIENAQSDRKQAQVLLDELKNEMQEESGDDPEKHERSGETATKYLRTIQKSNKQIIDVIKELRRLQKDDEDSDTFSVEGDSIFEDIQEEEVKLEEVED